SERALSPPTSFVPWADAAPGALRGRCNFIARVSRLTDGVPDPRAARGGRQRPGGRPREPQAARPADSAPAASRRRGRGRRADREPVERAPEDRRDDAARIRLAATGQSGAKSPADP